MILICGMATYGAYKVNEQANRFKLTSDFNETCTDFLHLFWMSPTQQHAAWIIPFFCYQIFDFALNTLVAISVVVYPNTVQDYLQQLVRTLSLQTAAFINF